MLKDIASKSINGKHCGYDLAGNIQIQNDAVVDDKSTFKKFVEHHLSEFLSECSMGQGNFTYHLGNGPWINYMKKHEFNPLHTHDGVLSAVIFIDVPEEITKEKNQWEGKTNCPSAGELEFVHIKSTFNTGHAKVTPVTGDMYMFPAEMPHTVYPYSSDVTRISMSFNIFDLQFSE